MSGLIGADVEQLRALAAQFEASAEQLDAGRMTVGDAIRVKAWFGPNAIEFRAQWDNQHSLKVKAAAQRLRDAATTLRRNADDQEHTSADDGGVGGERAPGIPLLPSPSDPDLLQRWRDERWNQDSGFALPGAPRDDGMSVPKTNPGITEHSVFSWLQDRLEWTPDRSAPVLGSFDAGFFLSKLPGVGHVTSAIGLGDVLYDPNAGWRDRAFAVADFVVDAGSSALKAGAAATGAVGYLGGVAVAQVWDVVSLASQTDWGVDQAMRNFDYVVKSPGEAAVAAAQAVVDYVPDLIDNLWPF
ncbi:hypothetical protein AB1K54_08140 [Microbacterium sp. BWT-B31]|uniref:WXG100 family type VII secretion target n=1 Tax=Microbacterium sp. BWT-B31 TaxID=3232072 RepID=UPI003529D34F